MAGLVENLRQIGLFVVIAQMLVHLVPGEKYEKYCRFLVGIVVLLKFITPFYKGEFEWQQKWNEQLTQMYQEMEQNGSFYEKGLITQSVTKEKMEEIMEEEVRDKLNAGLEQEGITVCQVNIRTENGENGELKLAGMEVYIKDTKQEARENDEKDETHGEKIESYEEKEKAIVISKVEVEKISISEKEYREDTSTRESMGNTSMNEEEMCALQYEIGQMLGVHPDRVKVIVGYL